MLPILFSYKVIVESYSQESQSRVTVKEFQSMIYSQGFTVRSCSQRVAAMSFGQVSQS